MDLVLTTADVKPTAAPTQHGHHGGMIYSLIEPETVGSEAVRVALHVYSPGGYTEGHPIHPDWEQAYYIVSGTMTVQIAGRKYRVPAGSFVYIPRGVEHNHRNDGQEELKFINITVTVRGGEVAPLPKRD